MQITCAERHVHKERIFKENPHVFYDKENLTVLLYGYYPKTFNAGIAKQVADNTCRLGSYFLRCRNRVCMCNIHIRGSKYFAARTSQLQISYTLLRCHPLRCQAPFNIDAIQY